MARILSLIGEKTQEKKIVNKRTIVLIFLASLVIPTFLLGNRLDWLQTGASQGHLVGRLSGLRRPVEVVRDASGVPHITASSDHDVYFMEGYLHAQDRFFQMDVLRRQGSGTLAEILGVGPDEQILASDIQSRAFGVNRSAESSLSAYSPKALALIQAYSDGVNAWLDSHHLPVEYTTLEITQVPRWKPLDSVRIVKLIQFQLSFDASDLEATNALLSYQAAGRALGFDGTRLFFEDIFRFTPFDPVVTISRSPSDAALSSRENQSSSLQPQIIEQARRAQEMISPSVLEAASDFLEQFSRSPLLNLAKLGTGSNWWVVAGSKTDTGNAMLANDPHLALVIPSTFYEIHLTVDSDSLPMNVYGVTYAGVPGVFMGQNESISWGATNSSLDITDFFAESLVVENGVPTATRYKGGIEPLVMTPEEFKANQIQNGTADDVITVGPGVRPSGVTVPPATLIVPRRNNGLLIQAGLTEGLSIQYAGVSATRDLEGFFALARAKNLTDFKQGLQLLEVGSLNWVYADIDGNIATFINGKVPLREDLQAGTVDGLPPFFLRDGTGALRNEWLPRDDPGTGFGYESLPFEEMPQAVNPAQGFLVNANNDPIGLLLDNDPLNQTRRQGLYYLSSKFNPGFRAAKITRERSLSWQSLIPRYGTHPEQCSDVRCRGFYTVHHPRIRCGARRGRLG
jgi:penicillin G amidase